MTPNERVAELFNTLAEVGAVFPEDVQKLRAIADGMLTRHAFVRDPVKALVFLDSLAENGKNGDDASFDAIVHALCAEDVVIDLTRDKNRYNDDGEPLGMFAGEAGKLIGVVRKLPPVFQAQFFAAPHNVFVLADKGHIDEIAETIQNFPTPDQKIAVLSASHAAMGLAKHGKLDDVLSIVRDCPHDDQKASILSAAMTVYGIAEHGTAEERDELVTIIRALPPEHRANALASYSAVYGLVKNGKGEDVMQMIEQLEPELQDDILKAPTVAVILKNSEFEARITAVIQSIAQHQQRITPSPVPAPH